uniref:Uncharacterized protein n=1 Tax=Strigamia maritima TaxID=126957 RepID=T1IMD3_STRMM
MLSLFYIILIFPSGIYCKKDLNFRINVPIEKQILGDFVKTLHIAYHKFHYFLTALSMKTTAMTISSVHEFKMVTFSVFSLVKGRRVDSIQQFIQTVRVLGSAVGKSTVAAVRAVSELTIRHEVLLARLITNVMHTLQDVHIAMIHILPKLEIEAFKEIFQ